LWGPTEFDSDGEFEFHGVEYGDEDGGERE
jgi:hypothetical protein